MAFSIGAILGSIATAVAVPLVERIIFGKKARPKASQVGPSVRRPTVTRAAFGIPAVPIVRGLIAALLARASAAIGKRMSGRSVVALIKSLGLPAAAVALGLTIEEAAQIFAAAPRRRRRGITARDISTTKRVIGVTHRIQHELSHLARPVRRRAPHHHHRS